LPEPSTICVRPPSIRNERPAGFSGGAEGEAREEQQEGADHLIS
jgi:hypothetical protein